MDSLLLVQIIKALVEVVLMLLLARGLLVLFFLPARRKPDGNFIYELFVKGTQPLVRMMRRVTPRFVPDRHLPFAAFAVLLVAWIGLSMVKLTICTRIENRATPHSACEQLARHRAATGMPR